MKFPKPTRKVKKPRRLRMRGVSDPSILKEEIQSVLRQIAIIRDGGCVFRMFPETGKCGGYRKDGNLILQFDHLNTRAKMVSFSDPRLGICVCKRHHLYYKKQFPAQYERCAIQVIGITRALLLNKIREDRSPHKVDLKLELIALRQELGRLLKDNKTPNMDEEVKQDEEVVEPQPEEEKVEE